MNKFIHISLTFALALLLWGCCGRRGAADAENQECAPKSYSGSGYADISPEAGGRLRFRLEAPEAGDYVLSLRYGVRSDSTATISLWVNGTKTRRLSLAPPPADSSWSDHDAGNIALTKGINFVDLAREEGDTGNVFMDYIEISKK
jgi:hypothetical protein